MKVSATMQGLTRNHAGPGAVRSGLERRELAHTDYLSPGKAGSPPFLGTFWTKGGALLYGMAGQEKLLSSYRFFGVQKSALFWSGVNVRLLNVCFFSRGKLGCRYHIWSILQSPKLSSFFCLRSAQEFWTHFYWPQSRELKCKVNHLVTEPRKAFLFV